MDKTKSLTVKIVGNRFSSNRSIQFKDIESGRMWMTKLSNFNAALKRGWGYVTRYIPNPVGRPKQEDK